MELLQLKYFFESAKYESFAHTAEKYMVPTTSVSASVKRLEKELGCQLFERLPNRILLNDNGRRLRQSLYIVFGELEEIKELLTRTETDNREIKMLVRAMRTKIMDGIIDYTKRNPKLSLKTFFDFDTTTLEEYDVIIDDDPRKYANYEKFELCSRRLLLKVSSNSSLCDRPLTLKQLRSQPFLSMGDKSSMHRILVSACEKAGYTPNIVVQTNDAQCYKKCLEAGIGIGIGRDDPAEYSKQIRFLDVIDFDVRQTVYCFYKKQDNYGNLSHFLDFLKDKDF